MIGPGAKVLEAIAIGANAIVVKSTPPNSVVVGVPGQVVVRDLPLQAPSEKADLEHGRLPDTISETLATLILHVEALEKRVNGGEYGPALHAPELSMGFGIGVIFRFSETCATGFLPRRKRGTDFFSFGVSVTQGFKIFCL